LIGGDEMAKSENGNSSAGIVAVVVIFLIIVLVGLFMFGGRLFGESNSVDVNVTAPAK